MTVSQLKVNSVAISAKHYNFGPKMSFNWHIIFTHKNSNFMTPVSGRKRVIWEKIFIKVLVDEESMSKNVIIYTLKDLDPDTVAVKWTRIATGHGENPTFLKVTPLHATGNRASKAEGREIGECYQLFCYRNLHG